MDDDIITLEALLERSCNPFMAGSFLYISEGEAAGHTLPLTERVTIGRSSQCTLNLTGQLVSRYHAEIVFKGDHFELRDLGSANGTFLNSRLVKQGMLQSGDVIRVGDTTLVVQLGTTSSSPPNQSHVVVRSMEESDSVRIRVKGAPANLHTMSLSQDANRAHRARRRLKALAEITENLTRLRTLEVLYPLIIDVVMHVTPAERGALLAVDSDGLLHPVAGRNTAVPGGIVEVSRAVVNDAVSQRTCVMSADALADENIGASDSIMEYNIRSVICAPIAYDGKVLGAIYLDSPGRKGLFSEEDLHFLSGVGGIAAVAITNARALEQVRTSAEELNRAYLSLLSVLANAIEARDHYTIGHTWRVARFGQVIARRLGWPEDKVNELEVGGVIHDIGKIGVPDSILTKPGSLTDEERQRMELHPQIGARMLYDVPTLQYALPYILHHHERYDGHGYPDGLKETAIPEEARLLAVADAFDAMTSHRPYRRGLAHRVAVAELIDKSGKQFDPHMVRAMIAAYDAGELHPYLQTGDVDSHDFICPFCSTAISLLKDGISSDQVACPTCRRRLVLHSEGGELRPRLA